MYLTDPDVFNISGVMFTSNEAASGGAIWVGFTREDETVGLVGVFHFCRFDFNKAFYGGALYLGSGNEGVFIQHSNFSYNVAGEIP